MTTRRLVLATALLGALTMAGLADLTVRAAASTTAGVALAQSDLDEFMRQVLARRDENWKKLQQYVLDEHEKMDVVGPALVRLTGMRRDYRWFIKDGYFVRSPLTIDGVAVPDAERRQYEDDFLRKAKERDKQAAPGARSGANAGSGAPPAADAPPASSADAESLIAQTRRPQFVDSAYFLRFKFEQGTYALVGREQFDGREVLRIEYYPARLFSNNADAAARDAAKPTRDRRVDVETERLMNKNSLVTLWVEPGAKQIVKYVFDNVQADFLGLSWLVRLDDAKASMTMSQPFKDVWLPRDVEMFIKAMFALGPIDVHYRLDYTDYQEATTSGRIIRGATF